MSYQTPAENDVLRKVDSGLELAVRDRNLSWSDENDTKRQKYTYLAVRAFTNNIEVPVTYSWFKYGASLVAAPPAQDSLSSGYTLRTESVTDTDLWRYGPQEFAYFFKNDLDHLPLDEYWDAHNLEFLEEFYTHYAPEEYRELYLANIHLRQRLESTLSQIQDTVQSESISEYERIGRILSRMEIELAAQVVFEPVQGGFEDFEALTEDVFMMLQQRDIVDLGTDELEVVTGILSLYRNHVWDIISHIISNQTATGPNSDTVRSWWDDDDRRGDLRRLEEKIDELREQADDVGLVPKFTDHPVHQDELDETIETVERGVDELLGESEEDEIEAVLEELSESE